MNEKFSPKVSIIIPVYNTEEYLKKCLDSVINQTLNDIEIILIDDGSTDNSGKICNEYAEKDKRIKVIHQENQGQGRVRNEGLKIAKGEYIGFVDSDDWIALDFYEKLYDAAIDKKSEVTIAKTINFYDKNNKYIELPEHNETDIHFKDVVWDSLYKKSFLDKNNIVFPENRIFEDVLFSLMINCFVKRRFFNVNSFYYRRKDRKNSTMYNYKSNFNAQNRLKIIDLCEQFVSEIKDFSIYFKAKELFYQRKINYLFEILRYDCSFFEYVKTEIKKIDFAENQYVLPDLKEKCEAFLASKNYNEFANYLRINENDTFFKRIKSNIIYFIYIILLKLGIKDVVKNILQKIGFNFNQ